MNNNLTNSPYLHLLTTGDKPIIKATTGQRFLAEAKDTFKGGIDPDFKKYRLNKTSYPTDEALPDVYELEYGSKFSPVPMSLHYDLSKFCFTQNQIEAFCLNNPTWLSYNGTTFFIFKENRQFFVATVLVFLAGLHVNLTNYGGRCDTIWYDDDERRWWVVPPQL